MPLSLRGLLLFVCLALASTSAEARPRLVVQLGHVSSVFAGAFSPDGRIAATGDGAGVVVFWDVATGLELRRIVASTAEIVDLRFSPDGRRLLVVSGDRTGAVWEVATANRIASVAGEQFSPDFAVAVTTEGERVRAVETATGAEIGVLDVSGAVISGLELASDARHVLVTVEGGGAAVWSLEGERAARTLPFEVSAVRFSPTGRYVIADVGGGALVVLETATLAEVSRLDGSYYMFAVSPDDQLIVAERAVSRRGEKPLRMCRFPGGEELFRFGEAGPDGEFNYRLSFSPDGREIRSIEPELEAWDAATGERRSRAKLAGDRGRFAFATHSPDGRLLLAAFGSGMQQNLNREAVIAETATGAVRHTLAGTAERLRLAGVSADGARAVFWTDAGEAIVWNLADGAFERRVRWHPGLERDQREFSEETFAFTPVALSPDGGRLFGGSGKVDEEPARVVDVETGDARPFAATKALFPARLAAFDAEGRRVALYSDDEGAVRVLDVESGQISEPIALARGGDHAIRRHRVRFSRDNRTVLAELGTRAAAIDVATGRIQTLEPADGVSHVVLFDDGERAVTGGAGGDVRIVRLGGALGADERRLEGAAGEVATVAVSADGTRVAAVTHAGDLRVWEAATGALAWKVDGLLAPATEWQEQSVAFSPEGRFVTVRTEGAGYAMLDAATGVERVRAADTTSEPLFFDGDRRAIAQCDDGSVRVWSVEDGRDLCRIVTAPGGSWVAVAPDGRFDTNDLEGVRGLHWIVDDAPFTPLPVEIFMRELFEPRLLDRLLDGEPLPPVADLAALDREQPEVRILDVAPAAPGAVRVRVEVARGRAKGVRDLRLFRDGQLVGSAPDESGEVALDPATGRAVVTFERVRLPRRARASSVELSAYAFNSDGVKSVTARKSHRAAAARTAARPRAFVVAIGVNAYENPKLDLRFAVNDARRLESLLARDLAATGRYAEVVRVALLSERAATSTATKAHVRAVFDLLSGREADPAVVRAIPGAARLAAARPNDLVVVTFSGHGVVDRGGAFHIVPSDADSPERAISADELARWWRDVDATDMAMIVDACQSAASVASEGFKPGPMGSRGLGQLAYDKGMRILAATQADNVALEKRELQQGLLSFALTHDGLEGGGADFQPRDRRITLGEWLAFAVARVPALYEEMRGGAVRSHDGERPRILVQEEAGRAPAKVQQPALFDFARRRNDAILRGERSSL